MDQPNVPMTPPAYVHQLERRTHELTADINDLKSMVAANHLSVMHEIGCLAQAVLDLQKAINVLTGLVKTIKG